MNFLDRINFSKLVTFEYWLEGLQSKTGLVATPVLDRGAWTFWFFLYTFTFLICIGIALRIIQAFLHPKHPLQTKLPNYASNIIWIGIIGWSWFVCRQLNIWFLGARFWLLGFLIWLAILGFLFARYLIKFYPLEMNYFKKNYKSLK